MNTKNKLLMLSITLLCLNLVIQNFSQTKAIHIPDENEISNYGNFLGDWYMQTIVVSSSCPFIIPGTTTESTLEIRSAQSAAPQKKALKTIWAGGKWATTNGELKLLNNKEAITERVTNIRTKDKNLWKSILIDHLKYIDKDEIELDSIVLQYKNSKFIGEYRTHSILTKNLQKTK